MGVKGWFTRIFFSILLLINHSVLSQERLVDIVLLVDSSPSMVTADPHNWRIDAACFFTDCLAGCLRGQHRNHRVAMSYFGGTVEECWQLQPPLNAKVKTLHKKMLAAPKIQFTDFRQPLSWAVNELNPDVSGDRNKKAVILFTDGRPQLAKEPLTFQAKKDYFNDEKTGGEPGMKHLLAMLSGFNAEFFVIAIGDSSDDTGLWQSLIPADHYRSIKTRENLHQACHEVIEKLLGLKAELITINQSYEFIVPSCLEDLFLTFIKGSAEATITLTDPKGKIQRPVLDNDHYNHEKFAFDEPSHGVWRVKTAKHEALMWIGKQLSRLDIKGLPDSLAASQPLEFSVSLLCHNQPIVDSLLQVKAEITDSTNGIARSIKVVPSKRGNYKFREEGLSETGRYAIRIKPSYNGETLNSHEVQKAILVTSPQGLFHNFQKIFLNWQWALLLTMVALFAIIYYLHKGLIVVGRETNGQLFAEDIGRIVDFIDRLKKWGFGNFGFIKAKEGELKKMLKNFTTHIKDDPKFLHDPTIKGNARKMLKLADRLDKDTWLEASYDFIKDEQPELNTVSRDDFKDHVLSPPEKGFKSAELLSRITRDGLNWHVFKKN